MDDQVLLVGQTREALRKGIVLIANLMRFPQRIMRMERVAVGAKSGCSWLRKPMSSMYRAVKIRPRTVPEPHFFGCYNRDPPRATNSRVMVEHTADRPLCPNAVMTDDNTSTAESTRDGAGV